MNGQDHYATLGLHRKCTDSDVRKAYRELAKAHHPDANPSATDAGARIHLLTEAYKTLIDPDRRRAHDEELRRADSSSAATYKRPASMNITQDIHIGIREFIVGTTLTVHVNDPANVHGRETYELDIPPDTAPGSRFRVKRAAPFDGGHVIMRVKARPDARFRVRGSDLRCDMRISCRRATEGGTESIRGVSGNFIRVQVPPHVSRGDVIRIPGEGMPKPRGGRGDILVRIIYRPEVRITRGQGRERPVPARGRKLLE